MMAPVLCQHNVSIQFLDTGSELYKTEKPFYSNVPFTKSPEARLSNVQSITQTIKIADIRGSEDQFDLDRNGFGLLKHRTSFDSWKDGKRVVEEHYPEVERLLKDELKAEEVIIYDHTLRLAYTDNSQPESDKYRQSNIAPPSRTAHVDSTLQGAIDQIRQDFGSDATRRLSKRFRIINFWRPLMEPVQHQPLALCDYWTAKEDFNSTDLIYPHTVTEIRLASFSKGQQWYFLDKQMMDEVWLLKIVDSRAEEEPWIAKCAAHTSFRHPTASSDVRPRESIEFRAYVFG